MNKIKNIILILKDQMPLKRLFRNFFITRNAWGLLSKRSHYRDTGEAKVTYNTKESATKAATQMATKYSKHFSNYKCLYCHGYHVGKNRDNK